MEGGISSDVPLDYASFQISPTQNRYEAFVCYNGELEKLASGFLEQLVLHLPQLKNSIHEEPCDDFKLKLPEDLKGSTWFTKSTLSRFLHIVGASELLKSANAIGDEMSQLEEARNFHLALYAQGHQNECQTEEAGSLNSKDVDLTSKPDLQSTSADATKNELLRAMDLRIAALREDLVATFRQAADGACSCNQIADLVAFCQYFGAVDLRNSLPKYMELSQKIQNVDPQNEQPKGLQNPLPGGGEKREGTVLPCSPVVKHIKYNASPAKAAQAERESSTESEESSNSSAEDQPYIERSRSLIRSASPRRSASPMRRVQIGRSGSRRATALTIKSLSYIPAKERTFSTRDAAGNSTDEEAAQPLKKPDNASSMSVKDAISLFERKQKDQSSDLQKKKFPADTSVNTSKSVLRRWSAGMYDPNSQPQSENGSENFNETNCNSSVGDNIEKAPLEPKLDRDLTVERVNLDNAADESVSPVSGEENTSHSTENLTGNGTTQVVESNNKTTASADWSRQKEDELNRMMMKMMESKPVRNRSMGTGVSRSQELPLGQRGGFYDHYKQKRDEKLRGENFGKRAEKEEKFRTLQGILDQKKVEMSSKSTGVAGKQDSLGRTRKPQKNPSPPLQPKKETSKSSSPLLQPKKESSRLAAPKKISPKASPVPATRKSWPSGPSPKTSVTPNKTPSSISSTGTTASRRKSQPIPSPIQPSPKVERSQPKQKSLKGTKTETKQGSVGQEGKKQRVVTRSGNANEAKALQASGDGSGVIPAKPSFYNKVTKKGSVVPLESKPFLRKRSGAGPGVAPVKSKVSPSDAPLSSENLIQAEEAVVEMPTPMNQKEEVDLTLQVSDVTDLQQEVPVHSHQNCNDVDYNSFASESDGCLKVTTETPEEIQLENESSISPAAWEEIEEHQEPPCDSHHSKVAGLTSTEPILLSSPRVRHSLSQMLQEDSGEPEMIEWGNAENPPAIVYQKDVPKGLKRLLKFARKNKGEANTTGWSSPSVFSDGEEDAEETKATSKRHGDAILRKASLQAKGSGQLRTSVGASYDGGNPSKRTDYTSFGDLAPGQSNMSKFAAQASEKLQAGHISSAASTKPRSFFSLSTFRSSKSNETKLR